MLNITRQRALDCPAAALARSPWRSTDDCAAKTARVSWRSKVALGDVITAVRSAAALRAGGTGRWPARRPRGRAAHRERVRPRTATRCPGDWSCETGHLACA